MTSETTHVKTLRQAKAGQTVRVARVAGAGPLRQRILDMGLTKGTEVTVRKVAPLGDPLEVTVRGYELTLRKAEAGRIELV
ncbi:MAG: ferrous iron transport protein A [Akkermansia sp.]|nr:ferrous iron transport protein A [Akkermansia sp.]